MLVGSKQLILMFIVLFLIFSFGIGQVVWIYLDSKKEKISGGFYGQYWL